MYLRGAAVCRSVMQIDLFLFWPRNIVSLQAGALIYSTKGQMGMSSLWILIYALSIGSVGIIRRRY
jgi:hypothetical protein